MESSQYPTAILFIESDERSFQFRKCIAQALNTLPPVELLYSADAEHALELMDSHRIDVVVIEDSLLEELEVLLDALSGQPLPILLQTEDLSQIKAPTIASNVTRVPKEQTLACIHNTLMLASHLAFKPMLVVTESHLH